MNLYHDGDNPDYPPSGELLELIERAKKGLLTRSEFCKYRQSNQRSWNRDNYVRLCSWAVYTKEWIESVVRLVKNKRVAEVAAGRGVLHQIMKARDIDWTCTDRAPPQGCGHVKKLTAVEAIERLHPEIVFASWIPYQEVDFDYEIACSGLPMLIVGEGQSGCTGSQKFWGTRTYDGHGWVGDSVPRPYEVCKMPGWFQNLPSWIGYHDYTYIVVPENTMPENFFNF